MIDTNATNNFISQKLAKQLKLAIEDIPQYTVELGTGQKEPSRGMCKGLGARNSYPAAFFLVDLGGVYVVLGMEWLIGLGEIVANFQELTMSWEENGEKRILQGTLHLVGPTHLGKPH